MGGVQERRTFAALRTSGIRVRRGPLSLTYLDDGADDGTRLAFAVTKKVGTAVTRNRIRRRIRAVMVDLMRTTPDLVPNGAILMSVEPAAVGRTPDELRNDVLRLLDALAARRQPVLEDR
ncbi:MAG: ribonuclease P protein component [Aquihabitans sp.]